MCFMRALPEDAAQDAHPVRRPVPRGLADRAAHRGVENRRVLSCGFRCARPLGQKLQLEPEGRRAELLNHRDQPLVPPRSARRAVRAMPDRPRPPWSDRPRRREHAVQPVQRHSVRGNRLPGRAQRERLQRGEQRVDLARILHVERRHEEAAARLRDHETLAKPRTGLPAGRAANPKSRARATLLTLTHGGRAAERIIERTCPVAWARIGSGRVESRLNSGATARHQLIQWPDSPGLNPHLQLERM